MPVRLTRKRLTLATAALLLSVAALGAEVQCSEAGAQRTSLAGLQAEIDLLQTQLDLLDQEVGIIGANAQALHVFDRNGGDLGLFMGTGRSNHNALAIFLEAVDVFLEVHWLDGTLDRQAPWEQLYFTQPACQGVAYGGMDSILPEELFQETSTGTVRYFVGRPEITSGIDYRSLASSNECHDDVGTTEQVVGLDEVTLLELGLSLPLAAPLFVGLPTE